MNKIFTVLLFLVAVIGCKKNDVDLLNEDLPEQRMAKRLTELQTKLTSAENGWIASLTTSVGGGYGFYMKFGSDQKVVMLGDVNTSAATVPQTSSYRVKWVMDASLIFDTYNYITLLQDPVPGVYNGTAGSGHKSDIEFEYIRSSADSVILRGKKYQNFLYLVKASKEQASVLDSKGYADAINSFNTFLSTRKSNYFTLNNQTIDLFFDPTAKTFTALSLYPGDSVSSVSAGFAYSLEGASLTDKFTFGGAQFTSIKTDNPTTPVIIDDKGVAYPLVAGSRPVIDFKKTFSYNNVFKGIIIKGQSLPAGVSSSFNSIFTGMVTRFNGTSRNIESVEFRFTGSTTFIVSIWYVTSAGARFLADASFSYTYNVDTGVITLSNYTPGSNGNWTTRATEIGAFATWVQNGPFRVDWAISTSPTVGTLGGLYKQSNEGDFFYGTPNP